MIYTGAEEDGIGGFFKGLGGGLAGVVTKPVAGVFGAVAGVTGAVKDPTHTIEWPRRSRCNTCNSLCVSLGWAGDATPRQASSSSSVHP